jgi:type 1 glutamine amidotransferase
VEAGFGGFRLPESVAALNPITPMPNKLLLIILCLCLSLLGASAAKTPYIVFVTGDHEYGSERSMPALAHELETKFGMRTKVLYATDPSGKRDENYEQNIPGLEELKKADLAVFFLRWRLLPKEQVALIDDYLKSGKPLMGFRTTSHSFHYPAGDPLEKWNAFGEFAFGTPPGWGAAGHTHYGHSSSTDVSVIESQANNALLKGVAPSFHVRSWLYHVLPKYPAPGSTPVLMGTSVKPEHQPAIANPVAWTFKTQWGARSFYTSMGHPEDFSVEPFQRLVVNAVYWALDKKEPAWPGKLDINVTYEKLKK